MSHADSDQIARSYLDCGVFATGLILGGLSALAEAQARRPGEKHDVVVYARDTDYASFPILARTDQ